MADRKYSDDTELAEAAASGDRYTVLDISDSTDGAGGTSKKQSPTNLTKSLDAASATVSGRVELATIAETDTGTDAARALTPAGLKGSALQTKVDNIEANAKDDQTAAEIRTLVNAATDSNVLTDALNTVLGNTSGANSGDLSNAQIKTAYEANADTNEFSDAEQTKVGHLSVTQAVDLDAIESRVNALDASVILKGTWDASVGTFPGGGTAQAGESWIVSVGGTVDSVVFVANDRIIAITDNASTATFAANWHKADYTDQVLSVAGEVGAISAASLRTAINVEDGSTADQTAAEIRALVAAANDSNVLTDALNTAIAANTTHKDSDGSDHGFIDQDVSSGSSPTLGSANITGVGGQFTLARIAGSTFSTIQHMQDIFHSAGWVSGGGITDDTDGTITVAAGTGLIRATNSPTAEILFTDWAAEAGVNVALTDNDISWIYVEYNAGTPRLIATTTERTDFQTNILLGIIARSGTDLHISTVDKHTVGDHAGLMIRRLKETAAWARVSGGIISETGTRNIAVTAGSFWRGITEFSTAAFDSSGAGTFSYWRRDGSGGFTETATQSDINNTQFDDGDGTLGTLSNNKYGVHWVYLETDDDINVLYGQGDYTLEEAVDAQPPAAVPERIAVNGFIVGKIIIKKSASVFTETLSAFLTTFMGSLAADHGGLAGLADDDHTQYLLIDGTRNGTLIEALGADHTASGTIASFTAGENVVFGDLVYIKSDGKLWKTDADAAATMPGLYMAIATIVADAAGNFLRTGFARDDTWDWVVGGAIYASVTPGALTQTAPSGAADVVQVIGYATHADRMDFNPDRTTIVIA